MRLCWLWELGRPVMSLPDAMEVKPQGDERAQLALQGSNRSVDKGVPRPLKSPRRILGCVCVPKKNASHPVAHVGATG